MRSFSRPLKAIPSSAIARPSCSRHCARSPTSSANSVRRLSLSSRSSHTSPRPSSSSSAASPSSTFFSSCTSHSSISSSSSFPHARALSTAHHQHHHNNAPPPQQQQPSNPNDPANPQPDTRIKPTPLRDDDIAELAKEPLHPLRLADLVKHGWPPLGEESLLQSADFALELIPVRLARRLQALRNLPYIVVSNPHVREIYGNYRHSLEALLPWWRRRHNHHYDGPGGVKKGAVTSLDEEIEFTDALAELVQTHQNTIPFLAQGFLECRKYIAPSEITAFLDEHLRARIGTRLIAEQHIALHLSSRPYEDDSGAEQQAAQQLPPSYIGVIDTQLKPARVVDSCAGFVADICELKYGVRPNWRIDGEPDTTVAYVPMHLEYIVTELLKNAFRAVVENKMEHEPVVITIAPEPPQREREDQGVSGMSGSSGVLSSESADETSASSASSSSSSNAPSTMLPLDDNAPGVTIRIRDRGGGISPEVLPNIWSYSFTTFNDNGGDYDDMPDDGSGDYRGVDDGGLNILSSANNGSSSIAGLGYGLPLSRAYAEFFGGGIDVQSLYGWGTDVYLRLKGVGSIEYKH